MGESGQDGLVYDARDAARHAVKPAWEAPGVSAICGTASIRWNMRLNRSRLL